jgi:hypothetical protein
MKLRCVQPRGAILRYICVYAENDRKRRDEKEDCEVNEEFGRMRKRLVDFPSPLLIASY